MPRWIRATPESGPGLLLLVFVWLRFRSSVVQDFAEEGSCWTTAPPLIRPPQQPRLRISFSSDLHRHTVYAGTRVTQVRGPRRSACLLLFSRWRRRYVVLVVPLPRCQRNVLLLGCLTVEARQFVKAKHIARRGVRRNTFARGWETILHCASETHWAEHWRWRHHRRILMSLNP